MTTPSEMVPETTGIAAGDSGPDVRRLQRYLERFGYLDSPSLALFGVDGNLAEAAAETGTFDDNTRAALLKFQQRYGLELTGVVDEATLDLMNTPRCGFPDTAEFVAQGNKWSTTGLRYGYTEFTPDLTQAEIWAAVSTALGYWAAVTPLRFAEVPIADNPEIRIRPVITATAARSTGRAVCWRTPSTRRRTVATSRATRTSTRRSPGRSTCRRRGSTSTRSARTSSVTLSASPIPRCPGRPRVGEPGATRALAGRRQRSRPGRLHAHRPERLKTRPYHPSPTTRNRRG